MSYSNGPRIVTNGLILCLDAGNSKSYPGSGSVWYDLSGNNNNATLNNGSSYISINGGSIRTDGYDDYIGISNNDNLGDNFSAFSINFTALTRTGAGADAIGYIIHRSTSPIIGSSVYAIYMANNSLTFTINGTSNLIQIPDRHNIISDYCYTWNGSLVSCYVNGILYQSISFSTFTNTRAGSVLNLGSTSLNAGYRPANCDFYNFRIYNRSLSLTEIQQNHNALKGRFGLP
jgi:hypothetical protein